MSATLSPRGDAVILMAVNAGLEAISRPLDFSAFAAGGPGADSGRSGVDARLTPKTPASPTSPTASPSPSESSRADRRSHRHRPGSITDSRPSPDRPAVGPPGRMT